jgi:hypothetical protein
LTEYIRAHRSDLEKIRQALEKGHLHLKRMNEMNAALHMSDPVYSPLTTLLGNARTRVDELLDGVNTGEIETVDPLSKGEWGKHDAAD